LAGLHCKKITSYQSRRLKISPLHSLSMSLATISATICSCPVNGGVGCSIV